MRFNKLGLARPSSAQAEIGLYFDILQIWLDKIDWLAGKAAVSGSFWMTITAYGNGYLSPTGADK